MIMLKYRFFLVLALLLVCTILNGCACGSVSQEKYPPLGHWQTETGLYLTFDIDKEKQEAYHGTYKKNGIIKDSVVFSSGFVGRLTIFDASVYNFETGATTTTLDYPLYYGNFKLKNGTLYFELKYRDDGIEDLETIEMKNINEESIKD